MPITWPDKKPVPEKLEPKKPVAPPVTSPKKQSIRERHKRKG